VRPSGEGCMRRQDGPSVFQRMTLPRSLVTVDCSGPAGCRRYHARLSRTRCCDRHGRSCRDGHSACRRHGLCRWRGHLLEMVKSAHVRLDAPLYWPVNGDGQALPFKDGAFDAVVCQLGLQFFPDPAAGLSECQRVVRAGGMVAVCVNSTPDRLPMWGNLSDALDRFLTQEQRNVLAMSWSLADRERLEWLFSDAGFLDIRVEQIRREGTIDGFDDYWSPIEEGVGQIPQTYRALDGADRRAVREEVRARLAQYETRDGKMTMAVEVLIGRGRARFS
jgi:SAM-dependent methyltransferase